MYNVGQGVDQSFCKAVELFTAAATRGHAAAMHALGEVYLRGLMNVKQDDATAFKWLTKAAEKGNSNAKRDIRDKWKCSKWAPAQTPPRRKKALGPVGINSPASPNLC